MARTLAVVVSVLSMTLVPERGATATTADACAGVGQLTTADPLLFVTTPLVPTTTSFSMTFTTPSPNCAKKSAFSATGILTGWCMLASGTGVTSSGRPFSLKAIGGIDVTGAVSGYLTWVPDVLQGQSCATGARTFRLAGFVVKHPPCTATTTTVDTFWGPLFFTTCV